MDERNEQVERDELEEEEAELLPDREAMSVITPGFELPLPPDEALPPV